MSNRILFFLYFYFGIMAAVHSQHFALKVVAVQGMVTVHNKSVKAGQKLTGSQVINITANAYLLVADSTGNLVEVAKKGLYKVSDLHSRIKPAPKGSKYARLIADDLTDRPDTLRRGKVTVRATTIYSVMLPFTTHLFGNRATFRWQLNDAKLSSQIKEYHVQLMDISESIIYQQTAAANVVTLNMDLPEVKAQENILLKIIPVGKDGKPLVSPAALDGNGIIRLTGENYETVKREYEQLYDAERPVIISKLIEARFFEDKELYLDAINAFEEVLRLAPQVDSYQRLYERFMQRNGLKPVVR